MSERVQIILSNNFSYTGIILKEDEYFIFLKDKFNLEIRIAKQNIQIIKEVDYGN